MISIIITSFLVIIIMIFVMFFLLKNVVKSIDEQSKSYFVLKLQDYDYLVEEKSKKLKEIENASNINNEQTNIDNKIIFESNKGTIGIADLNVANYQVENVLESLKEIDEKFVIDSENIIKYFIHNIKTEDQNFNLFNSIKKKIEDYGIFNMFLLNSDDVKNKLVKMFNDGENKILNLYLSSNNKFFLESFLEFIDYNIMINDPILYVEVGDKKENYDYLSSYVKTIYNKKIYKGIIIKYKNKIYDYSLS